MLKRVRIGRYERGFLHRGQDYLGYLQPGIHWLWGFNRSVQVASTKDVQLQCADVEIFLRDPEVWEDVVVVDLSEDERALVWIDGRLADVLGPKSNGGRTVYWKGLRRIEVERLNGVELRFEHRLLDKVLAHRDGAAYLQEFVVPRGARGLLYVDEALQDELGPGRYAFWKGVARVNVVTVDLREEILEVSGQEILTRDKVSLRLNLSASFRVDQIRVAVESSADHRVALYRALQLALREAVGSRSLDQLLSSKDEVAGEIRQAVEERAQGLGLKLAGLGIKDVILPGEMKTLLNQVIEAEKRAQANVIQRREETAATRSLLNTAKLIEQSPTLLRLKELETVERMAASIDQVQILGGGVEQLVEQLLPKPKI